MPRKKQTRKPAVKKSAPKKTVTAKQKIKKEPLQLVKGMKDVLPADMKYFSYLEDVAEKVVKSFGFQKIGLPMLEKTELFVRSTGEETDIVQKEMYQFETKGGEDVTMRPEGTPGVARAYMEHGMHTLAQPVKLYYFAPFFRYEKPQAGRYRQFHQLGLEVIGSKHPVLDAEIIYIAAKILEKVGIVDYQVQINSGGCPECKGQYKDVLIDYLTPKRRQLCDDCKRRLRKNPYRVLDCKKDKCKQISAGAPPIVDYLCEECDKDFKRVLEYLDESEIPFNLNTTLMRGLDYYTKTVFEIWVSGSKDSPQSVVAGGGRYDGLMKSIGGRDTPGLGVALGVERIVEKLKADEIKIKGIKTPEVLLIQLGELAKKKSIRLFDELVSAGVNIRESLHRDSIKSQLRLADKMGVKLALIYGQKEAQEGMMLVRNMKDGVQELIQVSKLPEEIKKRLKTV